GLGRPTPCPKLAVMGAPLYERYDLPMRDLADVAAIEQVPLDRRIFSWNLNDWIDRGLRRDPPKLALTFMPHRHPHTPRAGPRQLWRSPLPRPPGGEPVPVARLAAERCRAAAAADRAAALCRTHRRAALRHPVLRQLDAQARVARRAGALHPRQARRQP